MTDTRVVLMTVPDVATAEAVAANVVEARLAACASILGDLTSVFWWEGDVRRANEVLVVMKTSAERVDALIARAAQLHPYDVPELLSPAGGVGVSSLPGMGAQGVPRGWGGVMGRRRRKQV